jgi:cell division protein FtsB
MRAFAIRSRIKPPHLGLASQFVIVLLVVALMGAMAIEPARQLLQQRERVSEMQQELDEVMKSNADLSYRIKRLSDSDFIEQRAREQIGLVREGEITYQVMPPSRSSKADKKAGVKKERRAHKPVHARAKAEEDPGFFGGLIDFMGL